MLMDIKPFVPSAVCLACDGCCRFREPSSPWRPRLSPQDQEQIAASGVKAAVETGPGPCGVLRTVPDGDGHVCQFFHPPDHVCRIYPARPLECRLYPFLLRRRDEEMELCAHLNCPYIQEQLGRPLFQAYAAWLKDFFSDTAVKEYLRDCPGLAADYSGFSDELLTVFKISL